MLTSPCNEHHRKAHLIWGNVIGVYRGVPYAFLFCSKTYCGYTLEAPHRSGSNKHPQSMFEIKNKIHISDY